jgi:transposase-like protein
MGMPKPEVRSKWSGLISEQSESGETVETFCRERGLTTSQFYTWRRRLRGSAAERFLEVQVAKPAVVQHMFRLSEGALRVDHPAGKKEV